MHRLILKSLSLTARLVIYILKYTHILSSANQNTTESPLKYGCNVHSDVTPRASGQKVN